MITPRRWPTPWIAVATTLLVCGVSHAAPATVAVSNDGGAAPAGHSNFDDAGWQFTNASPIAITALGLWANGGLVSAHQVSIYNLSGVLQVSAVVPTGLLPDAQGYVYASLGTPFALPAGTWIIAASYAKSSPDFMRAGNSSSASSVVMSSPLTFRGRIRLVQRRHARQPQQSCPGQWLVLIFDHRSLLRAKFPIHSPGPAVRCPRAGQWLAAPDRIQRSVDLALHAPR